MTHTARPPQRTATTRLLTVGDPFPLWIRLLSLGGLAGPALLVVADVAANLVAGPGYSPARQAISELGVSPRAWILNVPLVACGVGVVALAATVPRLWAGVRHRSAVAGLLAVFGACFGLAGILTLSSGGVGEILHFVLGFFVAMSALIAAPFIAGSACGLRPRRGRTAATPA